MPRVCRVCAVCVPHVCPVRALYVPRFYLVRGTWTGPPAEGRRSATIVPDQWEGVCPFRALSVPCVLPRKGHGQLCFLCPKEHYQY